MASFPPPPSLPITLRTNALLIPVLPAPVRMADIECAFARRRMRRIATTKRSAAGDCDAVEWAKAVEKAGELWELEVVHNPNASEFVYLPSSRRNVPVTWFCFVNHREQRREREGDRASHIALINEQLIGVFDVRSVQHTYCG